MADDAQVGDTVRLTIEGRAYESFGEGLMVDGTLLKGTNRTVEVLSRATPPLPSEPGTWWVDKDDDVWKVGSSGLRRPGYSLQRPELYAPFRQLVLK